MTARITQALLFTIIMAGMAFSAYAADDKFSDDNFLTSSINAIFDKVNKVTSGEEGIFIKDYNKSEENVPDYSKDALGRKIKEPTIRSSVKGAPAKDAKE